MFIISSAAVPTIWVMELEYFDRLVRLISRLRKECPWDREQTIESMSRAITGEYDELMEAIGKRDYENVKEEIGDLLWSLLLVTEIAKENRLFDLDDVLKEVADKMVRRHPHVFGDKKAETAEEARKMFYEVKKREKGS